MEVQNSEYWKNRPIDDSYMDWHTDSNCWIEEYWKSKNHPHRKQILNILNKLRPWNSLLEIGCNCGVNLANIRKKFGNVELSGIDANKNAIEFAKDKLPDINFTIGDIENSLIKFKDKEFACQICDAVLMYIDDKHIIKVISEISRITQKAIILCEWYDKSELGIIKGGHYARNYSKLLSDLGWKVREKKVIWNTSEKWELFGKLFIATRK